VVRLKSLETFLNAPHGSGTGEVEVRIAIAADLGGENVSIPRDGGEGFAKDRFGAGEAVERRHIKEVDAEIEGGVNATKAIGFINGAKDAA